MYLANTVTCISPKKLPPGHPQSSRRKAALAGCHLSKNSLPPSVPPSFFHHQSHHLYLSQGGKVDHCSNCHLSLKDSKYHILACSGCKGAVAGCHLNKSLIPLFFSFTSLTLILTLRANKVTNTNYTGKAKQRAEYCFSH